MFTNSEDAIEEALPVSFRVAKREFERHGVEAREGAKPGTIEVLSVFGPAPGASHGSKVWETIGCNTRDVLVYLGY